MNIFPWFPCISWEVLVSLLTSSRSVCIFRVWSMYTQQLLLVIVEAKSKSKAMWFCSITSERSINFVFKALVVPSGFADLRRLGLSLLLGRLVIVWLVHFLVFPLSLVLLFQHFELLPSISINAGVFIITSFAVGCDINQDWHGFPFGI